MQVIGLNVRQSWDAWVEEVILRGKSQPPGAVEEEVYDSYDHVDKLRLSSIRQSRQNSIRARKTMEGPNKENQTQLGAQIHIVEEMLNLCFCCNTKMASYGLFALCAISYDDKVSHKLGRIDNFVQRVINLCHSSQEPSTRTQASFLLANMALNNDKNQRIIATSVGLKNITDICKFSDVYGLEGGTAVLANLKSSSSQAVLQIVGIGFLFQLLVSTSAMNLLDSNQCDEIYANVLECLANMPSSVMGKGGDRLITDENVKECVSLCASANIHVQENASLVLGNIARAETYYRYTIGNNGGVEALLILCEKGVKSATAQANAYWALSILAWDPTNQERLGRFFGNLISACQSSQEPVQNNALCCLANCLHYNLVNQKKIINMPDFLKKSMASSIISVLATEHILRILISISYSEVGALKVGKSNLSWVFLQESMKSTLRARKLAGIVVLNLAAYDEFKPLIYRRPFVDEITAMQKNEKTKFIPSILLDKLGDLQPPNIIIGKKSEIGVIGMLKLSLSKDISVQKCALNFLAEYICRGQAERILFIKEGGVSTIMNYLRTPKNHETNATLSAIYVLQNIFKNNIIVQERFGSDGGI